MKSHLHLIPLCALLAAFVAPALVHAAPPTSSASVPILDKQHQLDRFTFWDNRDWDWYKRSISFFESPDDEIDATYYYRWELVTKHLVYGSPESGYNVTEFIDRPGWSGRYGSISCPMGHQMYELRWLKDRRVTDDYARYWFSTPGAQPRSYSNWYADALWASYLANGDRSLLVSLLPSMETQYRGWMAERWDADHQMFHWSGMHDGMEFTIGSRQTKDTFAGADSYRPTLNSYVYADLIAISRASELAGDTAKATSYRARANALKARILAELWDPKRQFFLSEFRNDEASLDGTQIKAGSLMYQTGKFAGDPHGRELSGYIPWEFHLPDPGKGYEAAWKGVSDPDVFLAPYGLFFAERHDPLFLNAQSGCVWSGNNWPYADAQVLTAMANVLNDYPQTTINKTDYLKVLKSYTRSQRKDGRPYGAEDQDPITGRWIQDEFNHSEDYFHSSYCDLIVTGLAGLRPRADDVVEVNPLIPDDWPYFALDDVAYHGHKLSIVWDRDGTRYHRGAGLSVWVDGRRIAGSPHLGKVEGRLPSTTPPTAPTARPINFAVNNDGGYFPQIHATYTAPDTSVGRLNDGVYFYDYDRPVNRWTTVGTPNATDTIELRFGIARPISTVKLYFLDDGDKTLVRAPASFALEYQDGTTWKSVPGQRREPGPIVGHRPTVVIFPTLSTDRLRVVLTPQNDGASDFAIGMTEFEAWGDAPLPLPVAPIPAGNLALTAHATASFTSQYDKVEEINDGKIEPNGGRNRWTAYSSPNPTDWVQLDFGKTITVGRVELVLWADGGGVRPPKSYILQYWNGTTWADVHETRRDPATPTAGVSNEVTFDAVHTDKLRVTFTHNLPGFSGATEWMVWEK